jgi:phosphoribosyl-ATP pyrophosphohydrolase
LQEKENQSPLEGSYTNKLLTDKALSKAKVLEEVDELLKP